MDLPTFFEHFLIKLPVSRTSKRCSGQRDRCARNAARLTLRCVFNGKATGICRACRAQFSVTNGMPMEGTHLPLRTWFGAIFLMATSSKGISAMVLSRQLDLGYKTAWFLAQRIRNLMPQDWEALRGLVAIDKRYLGGKRTTKRASKRDTDSDQAKGHGGSRKSVVAVERGKRGKARAKRGGAHVGRTIPISCPAMSIGLPCC
jgi:hypothetical protein